MFAPISFFRRRHARAARALSVALFAGLPRRFALVFAVVAALPGCTTIEPDQLLALPRERLAALAPAQLALALDESQRAQLAAAADVRLAAPLDEDGAVQLALDNSPALQALLAQAWADANASVQAARALDPVLGFEHLSSGTELDITRRLGVSLIDLLTLPQRQRVAQSQLQALEIRLAGDVVDAVAVVRQAWVRAVAGQQALDYAGQVMTLADASGELAQRMQAAGNFSRLEQARHQAFLGDAQTRLAGARIEAATSRELLVRALGLDDTRAARLQLPGRLPDLPADPRPPALPGAPALAEALDVRLAQADYETALRAQHIAAVSRWIDVDAGLRSDSGYNADTGASAQFRGYELSVRLPVFDWGGVRRETMNARTLAAADRLESATRAAGSRLRQAYGQYRGAYDLAQHFQREVIPLRREIAREDMLRYNGMLISVFQLLADAREQVEASAAAIAAQRDYWMADASLQSALLGHPGLSLPMP